MRFIVSKFDIIHRLGSFALSIVALVAFQSTVVAQELASDAIAPKASTAENDGSSTAKENDLSTAPLAVETDEVAGEKQVDEPSAKSHARELSFAFRNAAEKALPSVVTILASSKPIPENASVLDIIERSDEKSFDSIGSGVIVSKEGVVLTNHHVVADSIRTVVRLPDGRQFEGSNIKSDKNSDVAILQIETDEELPVATIGDSNDLYVGDWVLAIGSPFTLESSVSAGIISGTHRRKQLSQDVSGLFIQTDAAINPGNSGGALVDLDGRVVGINTAISSHTGGFEGIGFAIPIARADWIRRELTEFGKVRRAYAGVRTSNVPFEIAQQLDLPRLSGALVNAVVPGYPAADAGLKSGDIIVECKDESIKSAQDFAEVIQQSPIGEPMPLRVMREGEFVDLEITLIERP